MELIEGVALSKLCDYSFGDQSGQWGNIYTSFMREANLTNVEFVSKLFEIKKSRNYMTLFIDNIRLYKRHIVEVSDSDRPYVDSLHSKNDLLHLCENFPDMKFIIFTNLEDTPIDEHIFDVIPENVLCISAVNAIANGGKVVPAPYGVQRKMSPQDNRIENLIEYMGFPEPSEFNLLYVSHNENSHSDRVGIKSLFVDKKWAIVDKQRVEYGDFLSNLRRCKFMLCPRGCAIDCHRNWEVLYMRRVPVMKRHPYLETLFKNYPVLFVDNYADITEELLIGNEDLYQRVKHINHEELILSNFYNKIVTNNIS